MYLGNQKAHRITTGIFFKKDSWNVRLEKQEIQVSFLFSKKKETSKITNYSIFVKPARTIATNPKLRKCHTWTQYL